MVIFKLNDVDVVLSLYLYINASIGGMHLGFGVKSDYVGKEIECSNGGIVPWPAIKRQIERHLYEGEPYVSMLVDYYGIRDNYHFPGWQESKGIANLSERMNFLWNKMLEDISPELSKRFIPYLQMHEFESLLFSDLTVFYENFDSSEMDISILEGAVKEFHNPEDINSRPEFAPSKRLLAAIKSYDKVVFGSCLASEIGLENIMKHCPLFRGWVNKLLTI